MLVFVFFLKLKGHNEEMMNICLSAWLIPGLIKLYGLWGEPSTIPTCIVEAFRQNTVKNHIWNSKPTPTY